MCFDPVTASVLSFAVGAAQSVAQYQAASQESKAAQQAATASYENDQHQLSLRQMQEQDATAQKASITNIEEAQKVADVQVSASGANLSGISVDNLIADVRRQGARNRDTQQQNLKNSLVQLQAEKRGSRVTNQGRINSVPRPSALSLVAGIAGAGLNGYNTYNKQMQL